MHDEAQTRTTTAGRELEIIGHRLRSLRKSNRLSQREVAGAIGLPQSNLSRIENGKQRLNLTVLARMLGIYEMTIQDFFAREADEGLHGEPLSVRERQMLEAYRRLSPDDRRDVDSYVDYKLFRARHRSIVKSEDCF